MSGSGGTGGGNGGAGGSMYIVTSVDWDYALCGSPPEYQAYRPTTGRIDARGRVAGLHCPYCGRMRRLGVVESCIGCGGPPG